MYSTDALVEEVRNSLPSPANELERELLRGIILTFAPDAVEEVAVALTQLESQDNRFVSILVRRDDVDGVHERVRLLNHHELRVRERNESSSNDAGTTT
jgi:hypothetical protein